MSSLKYKGFHRRKLNSERRMVVSSLRKENDYLKKTLVEMSRQHSEHNKLVEGFLSLETVRLESRQLLKDKDKKIVLPTVQLSKPEKPTDTDPASDGNALTDTITELQNQLTDALVKNKQWLEYDQQREAYVRAILGRMLWLEKQLNEANQARSQQHNEDHSDEKKQIREMHDHYERLLQKAKDELQVLREQVNISQKNLILTQNWCKERESEVEELKQQLAAEKVCRKTAPEDPHFCKGDDQELRDETKDLQSRLEVEKRRSANFELQANLCQKLMINHHYEDQETIADLERQIQISSQDLEDERQNCSYLKKQMFRVLKMLQKTKDTVKRQSKRDQQECGSYESALLPSMWSRDSLTSSHHGSLLNESFLECPNCRAEYPASHYRELMNHLEICLD